jgi:hypothetical protein
MARVLRMVTAVGGTHSCLSSPSSPAAPAKDTLLLRVDRALHENLKAYTEFIASSKDDVISQALHRLFRQDKEFAAWLTARPEHRTNPVD